MRYSVPTKKKIKKADEIFRKADAEDRDLTREESKFVRAAVDAVEGEKATEARIKHVAHGVVPSYAGPGSTEADAPGDVFVKSDGYKRIADPSSRGSNWSSGPVEVKATLFEGDLDSPGDGGALVQPDVRPGVQPILFQPPRVIDLLGQQQTSSNKVRTIVETVADAGSIGTVEEGALKPEAALEFEEVDEPVRKIATFLPVSDEMVEDAPALRAYINARLTLFVQMEEEGQILNASGAGIDLEGLLYRVPGDNQSVVSDAVDATDVDHVYAAIVAAEQSYLPSDGIVVNPADWSSMRLLKDGDGNYIAGSPFSNGPAQPGETLFGRRVVVTQSIEVGTVLVGAFATAATVFRRGGLTVEASNSHEDYFRRNKVAIRAESRIALAVHRPEAFATADVSGS